MHPGAARHAHRAAVVPAPQLGPDGAVRQRLSRAARRGRRLQPPDHRPLSLLGGRRRHLSQPLRLLRVRARPGGRSVEGDGAAALGAAARDVPRAPVRHERSATTSATTSSIANSSARSPSSPRCSASRAASSSSSRTAMPTTGSCRSRPSIRTSRSMRRRASRSRSTPAGTGPSATGRAMAASTSCRPNARSCGPTTTPSSRMCDFLLGQLLDDFDRHDMWKDTALVVTTDHGFLLGEHDFWAKNRMNLYEELVHIPLFMHDPRAPAAGRHALGRADPDDRHRADLPRSLRRGAAGGERGPSRCSRRGPARRCARRRCSAISAAR